MEHKEKLYRQRYYWNRKEIISFRYRYDPIPMLWSGKRRSRYFRTRIRTTQEKRWSYAHSGYFRLRRTAANLTCCWDDWVASDQKERSWKGQKKKHQWE